jgi:hypothetical protein
MAAAEHKRAGAVRYPTYWVNRFNLPAEKLGEKPDGTSNNFQGLLDFVLDKE